jgi:hypothetical protein
MLSRKTTVSRRARYTVRLDDHSRPHGRRRGYTHARHELASSAPEPKRPALGFGFVAIVASVFVFLLLVAAGAFTPQPAPLTKHEPVSSARVR